MARIVIKKDVLFSRAQGVFMAHFMAKQKLMDSKIAENFSDVWAYPGNLFI
jgi:hypothetical protein